MKLIVGLGNPKKKYEKTRHNVGFRVIDELLNSIQETVCKKQKKFNAEIVKVKFNDNDLILVKPLTFMNNSGLVIKKLIHDLKFKIQNFIVIHDDIDLLFGDIRVSKNSSSAGHKGVQSIIDELKTKDFTRIRIGIKPSHEFDTTEFVLKKFSKEEEKKLEKIIPEAVEIIKKELRPTS